MEERMLRAEEIELMIAFFFFHQVCKELATISGNELCCKLYNVEF